MIADGLTKNQSDPADLMRAILANGVYQLSGEADVLAQKKAQRDRRARRQQLGDAVDDSKPSQAVFRKVYVDHQATFFHPPEDDKVVQGRAVRRTSFDGHSGRILASEDLQETLLCEKQPLPRPMALLRTEIWYERFPKGDRV